MAVVGASMAVECEPSVEACWTMSEATVADDPEYEESTVVIVSFL